MGDYVAALGVLILELDTYRLADWTDQDIDPKTNNRSNQYRLARILDDQEWKENIEAAYKRIGEACLDFMIHVLNFEENSPLENEIAPLAVLYKEVLSPLYILLVSRFGTTINLLPEVSRITATSLVPTAPGPLAHSIILFDDLDSAESDERYVLLIHDCIQSCQYDIHRTSNFVLCNSIIGSNMLETTSMT